MRSRFGYDATRQGRHFVTYAIVFKGKHRWAEFVRKNLAVKLLAEFRVDMAPLEPQQLKIVRVTRRPR